MKTHRVRFCILSISATLLLLALSACKPCGCSDADLEAAIMQLLPGGLASAHFHFESPWFSEDRFTLELRFTNPPPAPLTSDCELSLHRLVRIDDELLGRAG